MQNVNETAPQTCRKVIPSPRFGCRYRCRAQPRQEAKTLRRTVSFVPHANRIENPLKKEKCGILSQNSCKNICRKKKKYVKTPLCGVFHHPINVQTVSERAIVDENVRNGADKFSALHNGTAAHSLQDPSRFS